WAPRWSAAAAASPSRRRGPRPRCPRSDRRTSSPSSSLGTPASQGRPARGYALARPVVDGLPAQRSADRTSRGPDRELAPQLEAGSERPAYRRLPRVRVPVRLEQVRAAVVRPQGELGHRLGRVATVVVDDRGRHVDVLPPGPREAVAQV